MPPATNDNQGLKIAVALFAALSVVLGVATYFGFSEASKNAERYEQANADLGKAKQAQGQLQNQLTELQDLAGYPKVDAGQVKEKVDADMKALIGRVAGLNDRVQKVYADYKTAGGQSVQADQLAEQSRTIAESLANEPNKTLGSTIGRLTDLLDNQGMLLANVAADYQATRKDLEASNQVAQQRVNVEATAREQAEESKQAELTKHEEDRRGLVSRLDELQSRNQSLANELAATKSQLAQQVDEWQSRFNNLRAQFLAIRERQSASENVLESSQGRITHVDYTRGEVRTSLTRRDGAQEQMQFSVFDREAPGIPTDRPKGTIELIRVDDQGSIGRIVRTVDTINPLRSGDQLYSPGFAARPRLFALIGKIDMNRDGRDDREDLKRMIRAVGGEVVYDLPPAGLGQESGELSPRTDWYVIDDREPLYGAQFKTGASPEEIQEFNRKQTKALSEARLSGVRPISIERLLALLNYRYGAPPIGRVEAADRQTQDRLLNPRGIRAPQTPPGAEGNGDAAPDNGAPTGRGAGAFPDDGS
jgi:hypothetical protein